MNRGRILSTCTFLFVFVLLASAAWAQVGSVLYSFTGSKDGANPQSKLLMLPDGSLVGTTTAGGANGEGEVFQLTPGGRLGWTLSILHDFKAGADGDLPAAGVIRDRQGNLYGTVYQGGAFGHGAVYELVKNSDGTYTNNVIYSFTGGDDGGQPVSEVIFDKSGNLYGTTSLDGKYGQGVVFKLTPNGDGTWTETVLHAFVSQSNDAQGPGGALVFDAAGNLYGVSVQGGTAGLGAVYQLAPNGTGGYKERVIYSFRGGSDGATPARSDLIVVGKALYGTTTNGGTADDGTVFQMLQNTNGRWQERVIYSFPGGANGANPYAGVIRDSAGNLYGTTATGVFGAGGVVFKLTKGTGNTWTQSVLYTFDGAGNGSYADLIRDSAGNLYGTTEFGGPNFAGDVFQVMP